MGEEQENELIEPSAVSYTFFTPKKRSEKQKKLELEILRIKGEVQYLKDMNKKIKKMFNSREKEMINMICEKNDLNDQNKETMEENREKMKKLEQKVKKFHNSLQKANAKCESSDENLKEITEKFRLKKISFNKEKSSNEVLKRSVKKYRRMISDLRKNNENLRSKLQKMEEDSIMSPSMEVTRKMISPKKKRKLDSSTKPRGKMTDKLRELLTPKSGMKKIKSADGLSVDKYKTPVRKRAKTPVIVSKSKIEEVPIEKIFSPVKSLEKIRPRREKKKKKKEELKIPIPEVKVDYKKKLPEVKREKKKVEEKQTQPIFQPKRAVVRRSKKYQAPVKKGLNVRVSSKTEDKLPERFKFAKNSHGNVDKKKDVHLNKTDIVLPEIFSVEELGDVEELSKINVHGMPRPLSSTKQPFKNMVSKKEVNLKLCNFNDLLTTNNTGESGDRDLKIIVEDGSIKYDVTDLETKMDLRRNIKTRESVVRMRKEMMESKRMAISSENFKRKEKKLEENRNFMENHLFYDDTGAPPFDMGTPPFVKGLRSVVEGESFFVGKEKKKLEKIF